MQRRTQPGSTSNTPKAYQASRCTSPFMSSTSNYAPDPWGPARNKEIFMRRSYAVFAALFLAAAASTSFADTESIFILSEGTFQSGAIGTGLVDIDITTGVVTDETL